MLAIQIERTGEPDVLTMAEVAMPSPGRGEVLVKQTVAGVNFIDTSIRRGRVTRDLPFIPGREGVGIVTARGDGATRVRVGERVGYSENANLGGYAQWNSVAESELVPIPDDIDDDTACALMLQGITAHYLCTSTYAVGASDVILVHAAAGGVGSLLVQLAKLRGASVIATAGGPEKVALAREAGPDHVIDYRITDFAAEVARITDGRGVHVAYDSVGLDTWERSLQSLRSRGLFVAFGASSGRIPPLDIQRLGSGGSLYVTRPTATDYKREIPELLRRTGELFAAVRSGDLRVRIGARYDLAQAADAHRALEARATTGKILLRIPNAGPEERSTP